MSRQKVWFSKFVSIPCGDPKVVGNTSADMTKRIMFAKKLILTHAKGFKPDGAPDTSKWVTYSTSTGNTNQGSFINGDRWTPTSDTDIWGTVNSWSSGAPVSNSGSTPHSWCVLKAPAQFVFDSSISGSETEFYMSMYKGTSVAGETPMGVTFKYREPSRVDATSYNSPMFSDYICGSTYSDSYAWGFANEGSYNKRVFKANYAGNPTWYHSFGASGTRDVRLLLCLADDGSYFMVLFEQGPAFTNTVSGTAINGISYIEACIKIPSSYNLGFGTMSPTQNVFTISNVCKPQNTGGLDYSLEYPHHQSITGKSGSVNLYTMGGNTSTVLGFQAAKLGDSSTSWGSNQVVKATPAWPFGYGSFYNPMSGNSTVSSNITVSTETRTLSTIIKNDEITDSLLAFPYYTNYGTLIQTAATSGVSIPSSIYPVCQVPDLYLSSGGIPPGTVIQSDGEYWLSVGELLVPVGSDTALS